VRAALARRESAIADGLIAAVLCALLPLQSVASTPAQDALSSMRALRLVGCDGHAGVRSALRLNVALTGAAVQWSRGATLKSAIERSGYREDQSAALHLTGGTQALKAALSQRLCASLTDPNMIDAGIYFPRSDDVWIVVATPFATPPPSDAAGVAIEVLRLVNAARAEPQHCGRTVLAAAPPLQLNELLNHAALEHAQDMLRYGYFEHAGHDGSSPAQRVEAAGYRYSIIGENLASGPQTSREAVQGWMSSPGHCQNIMDPRFAELGVAYAASGSGEPRIYWAQEFAAAR
jgi:uncharacterized protein YkwD